MRQYISHPQFLPVLKVLGANVLNIVSSFGSVILISKSLGVTQFADYSLLLTVQAFLQITQNALGPGILYTLNRNPERIFQVARASIILRLTASAGMSLLLIALCPILVSTIHEGRIGWFPYAFIAMQSIGFSVERHILQLSQALQHFTLYSIISSGARILKFIMIFMLYYFDSLQLLSTLMALIVTQFIALIPGMGLIWKSLTTPTETQWFTAILTYSRWIVATEASFFLGTRANLFMLSSFFDAAFIGAWALAETMIQALTMVSQSVNAVFSPKVISANTTVSMASWKKTTSLLSIVYASVIALSALCIGPVIMSAVGESYTASITLYTLMLPAVWITMSSTYSVLYLHRAGVPHRLFFMELVTACGLLLGNSIFIPWGEQYGAIAAVTLSRMAYGAYVVYYTRKSILNETNH